VWFDVLNELPKKLTWMEELECRFKHCIKLFTEGQFAKALNDNIDDVNTAVNQQATPATKWWELFCTLRGLLLLYLSKYPDKYNCMLDYEIRQIPFPPDTGNTGTTSTAPQYDPNKPPSQGQTLTGNYGEDVGNAYCQLLELAYQYVVSCILGELIFPCKEPCEPSCVILGTVEVVGDKVVHVCNCPRSYVWSFGSFWEVLVATLLGGLACETTPHEVDPGPLPGNQGTTPRPTPIPGAAAPPAAAEPAPTTPKMTDKYHDEFERICCSTAQFDCRKFVEHLQANQKAAFAGSTAMFEMFSDVKDSLRYAFNFTRPDTLSTRAFIGMDAASASQRAKEMNVNLKVLDQPLVQQILEPLQTFRSSTLSGPERTVYAYQSEGRIVEARSEWREDALLAPEEKEEINTKIASLQDQVNKLQGEIEQNQELMKSYRLFRERMNEELDEGTATKKRPAKKRSPGPQGGKHG
jgi:hypothetical protein